VKSPWNPDTILELARSYQATCLLTAAADWDLFTILDREPMTASDLALALPADFRALIILLDALVAVKLLTKHDNHYHVPPDVALLLTESSPVSILPAVRHLGNCHRRWIQLDRVLRTGTPVQAASAIRSDDDHRNAFISAMHNISSPQADSLIRQLPPITFHHLLDIGGASGTWTLAFLRAHPQASATLFDLPDVIPLARQRIASSDLADRVTLVPGDFYQDELPLGADLAWLSAIVHQNSRAQNRELFTKIHTALAPRGTIIIRDIVMEPNRTDPPQGALFAVNMLTATSAGGTYTFSEFQQDLSTAGFDRITLIRHDAFMNSLITATKK